MLNVLLVIALIVTGVLLHQKSRAGENPRPYAYAHMAVGVVLLLKILVHAVGKLVRGSATELVAAFGLLALVLLAAEVALGFLLYLKPELRRGWLSTAHRAVPVALAVAVALHVGAALLA